MAKDDFPQNDAVPLFLSDHAAPPTRSGVLSSRILKTVVVILAGAAIVFAIGSVGDPIVLFARSTTAQVSTSGFPDQSGRPMHRTDSIAIAQDLPPISRETPAGDELLAAFKTAFESQSDVAQPSPPDLFNQFQAWAAKKDAHAPVQHMYTVQDAHAQVAQKTRIPRLPKLRSLQPAKTARAQDQQLQNAQWPARSFGWHD